MLFNSYYFIFCFLPVALLVYYSLNHFKQYTLGKVWLIVASLYFYSYWNIKNLPLILLSISVNYIVGHNLHRDLSWISKKNLLRLGLVFNIVLLCFFKYADFTIFNINLILNTDFSLLNLALPLGVSFFTLQQIGYLVDAYEGLAEEKNVIDYMVFVSFFPQLISGPIVHFGHLMPQIEREDNKHFNAKSFSLGIFLFTLGLAKKVLISETFAGWARPGFDELPSLDFLLAWKTSLSYTFQLYYDFSGYTEMAIGLGHMFNVQLPHNFNSPFKSRSVIEFWNRWHMTLSQFINTYVFTPMVRGMPKITFRNTMIATFIAMFLAGVWHGAGWTFVVYGALHGAALVVNHIRKKKKKKLSNWWAWFFNFNFINITFVIFRAKDLSDALKVLKGMFGFSGFVIPKIGIKSVGALKDFGFKLGSYLYPDDYIMIIMFLGAIIATKKFKNALELEKTFDPTPKLAFYTGVTFVFCLFALNRITEFIYFNF